MYFLCDFATAGASMEDGLEGVRVWFGVWLYGRSIFLFFFFHRFDVAMMRERMRIEN